MDHTILVVDDEPASLRALERALSRHYNVLTAGSGESGLELLGRHPISLIVSDNRMPGLSGVEMLCRSRRSHPETVRIVLTGYSEVSALAEAINEGAVFYYLTKPWEPPDLLLAVRRGLEHLEAERQRAALMRELAEALGRAQREAEQKTRLLTTACHEIGTPVHLLASALDLLEGAAAVQESEWWALAGRNLAWLQRSVSQMHTGFRLRSGMVRLACRELDLGSQLAAVVAAVEAAAGARRVRFETEIPAGLIARADPHWLRQVWIALLSNAVRCTADGGRIAVAAEGDGSRLRVRIADDGIGMSREQCEVAFEAFSTAAGDLLLHGSGRFEHGARGMGLGLFIAKALVELHGGEIHLASEPGRGTEITVALPV